ncbi:11478_t:CDS:2 [Gigaspora margarita]|uniref:11478_t:CDS:1 n=1 Tax=Gigaspora margarita TaxID=4874 RepID=A0ABN7VJ07_GIGMA|nr:11478_t:CDS:2 [Gigaspora margarita]
MKEESNYPQSLFIKLFNKNKTFYYKIIKEGTYPPSNQCYYTKYSKHPIPDNYIVKTQYSKAKHLTKCFIQYKNKKPQFTIQFGLNFISKELNKIKARTNTKTNMDNKVLKISGPLLFGLTLLSVKNVRQTLSLDYNPKIHHFEDLSILTKRRKVLKIAHQVLNIVEEEKKKFFYPNDNIKIKRVQFEIGNEQFDISAISDIKQKINLKINKQIPFSLVDILQPIVFEEIEDIPDFTDKNIVTNILQKPDNDYTLVLYPATCLGMKAANAKHFCPWCDCSKANIGDTNKQITKSIEMIKINYSKMNDHLWELMLSDLGQEQVEETIWQTKILDQIKQFKVLFQFWKEKNNNNLLCTSLMGPDKLKILQNFNFTTIFQFTTPTIQVKNLWNQFYELYNLMQNKKTMRRVFREKAQNWLASFLAPSQGEPNKSNFIRGMYHIQDVTPYIHILVNHVPEFLDIYNDFGLVAFSCSTVEKKNYLQVCHYFQNILKDEGHENS